MTGSSTRPIAIRSSASSPPVVDRALDVAAGRGGSSFSVAPERPSVETLRHRYPEERWNPEVAAMIRGSVPVELLTVGEQTFPSTP